MSSRKAIVACLVLIAWSCAGPALAQHCSQSHRLGRQLIKVGDAEQRLFKHRSPDRTVALETKHGGAAGYRLDYFERDQTVQFYVQSGMVQRICRLRH